MRLKAVLACYDHSFSSAVSPSSKQTSQLFHSLTDSLIWSTNDSMSFDQCLSYTLFTLPGLAGSHWLKRLSQSVTMEIKKTQEKEKKKLNKNWQSKTHSNKIWISTLGIKIMKRQTSSAKMIISSSKEFSEEDVTHMVESVKERVSHHHSDLIDWLIDWLV